MKIVIATDSFKESLPANEVAEAIKRGFKRVIPDAECLLLPVGDGGEGTVDAIKSSLGLEEKRVQVTGPFGDEVLMSYFQKRELALFEVANLVGLAKIPFEKRLYSDNSIIASTMGRRIKRKSRAPSTISTWLI